MKINALLVLAATFSLSFMGRVAVLASDKPSDATARLDGKETATIHDELSNCINSEFAAAIKGRLATLDKEENSLSERKIELKAYELQIEKRLAELKVANDAFEEKITIKKNQRDSDIAKLAAIYEGMKPAQASEIMTEMDPKFAAGLLGAMSSEQAAQVVATMDSEKAYLVSVILANRSGSN